MSMPPNEGDTTLLGMGCFVQVVLLLTLPSN